VEGNINSVERAKALDLSAGGRPWLNPRSPWHTIPWP
jgi:hypothetical protein